MNTITAIKTRDISALAGFVLATVIGLGIVSFAGHVQASSLHDAAHDVRHATGFPCH